MKKMVMIVIPLLLIGGGVVGAAMMGVIDIPGLSPQKKKSKATAQYTEAKEEKPIAQKPSPKSQPPKKVEAALPSLDVGRKKLAKLWNEIESSKLLEITAGWKEEELAEQLRFLDPSKAAELLGLMKPELASKISRKLLELNSKPAPAL